MRLKNYDYSQNGAYFITICTQNRECLFGNIVDDKMRLNEFGEIACDAWKWLGEQYHYVALDSFVIMPNHLHGVIIIDNCRGGSRIAPTMRTAPTANGMEKRKPLGRLIGAFKTVSAKHINQLRNTPSQPIWQRNYYDHIIHNNESLERIRNYIVNNPLNWKYGKSNIFLS